MTPTQLRDCLETLSWTQRGLARIVGWDESTVRKWARGGAEIPRDVGMWLAERARLAKCTPPPVRVWRRDAA